jgi:hypothetical protein
VRLDGLALDGGGGGGVNQLVASITGGDTSQTGLTAVSSSVAVTGGETPYSYSATLIDPRGVDRTAILTGASTALPGFTPDLTGRGGAWVLRVVVTDAGGRTSTATKAVTVGQDGFVLARSIVSDGTTDAMPSAGSIAWGGVTFAAPNAGVEVVDGDLVLTGQASTDLGRGGVGTRTAALVSVSLNTLAGLAALGDRQVLIVVDVESYVPSTTNEALRVGLEQASAPIGSGTSGRGVCGGHSYSTTLRASSILRADGGGTGDDNATATIATIAGLGCLLASGGVRVYSETTAYDDAADVLADTGEQSGGMRGSATMATLDQVVIAVAKPTAGGGAACTIRGLQVWVR